MVNFRAYRRWFILSILWIVCGSALTIWTWDWKNPENWKSNEELQIESSITTQQEQEIAKQQEIIIEKYFNSELGKKESSELMNLTPEQRKAKEVYLFEGRPISKKRAEELYEQAPRGESKQLSIFKWSPLCKRLASVILIPLGILWAILWSISKSKSKAGPRKSS